MSTNSTSSASTCAGVNRYYLSFNVCSDRRLALSCPSIARTPIPTPLRGPPSCPLKVPWSPENHHFEEVGFTNITSEQYLELKEDRWVLKYIGTAFIPPGATLEDFEHLCETRGNRMYPLGGPRLLQRDPPRGDHPRLHSGTAGCSPRLPERALLLLPLLPLNNLLLDMSDDDVSDRTSYYELLSLHISRNTPLATRPSCSGTIDATPPQSPGHQDTMPSRAGLWVSAFTASLSLLKSFKHATYQVLVLDW